MHRTGFALNGNIQRCLGGQRQGRAGFPGHRQQGDRFFLQAWNNEIQLFRRTGVGDKQHHVAALNHSQIAVQRFGRVHEEGRGAGAGQRRGNLFADMAGFTDARHDHFAFAVDNGVGRADKILAQTFRQAAGFLQLQHQRLAARF